MGLLELLLEMLSEVVAELVLQLVLEAIIAFLLTVMAEALRLSERRHPLVTAAGYLSLGAATGGLSLIWFSSPLVHSSRFHGVSLIVSPILTGLAMALLGSLLRRYNKPTVDLESFVYGFVFALGMTGVRFLFVR